MRKNSLFDVLLQLIPYQRFDKVFFSLLITSKVLQDLKYILASHESCKDDSVDIIEYKHPRGDSSQPKHTRGRPPKPKSDSDVPKRPRGRPRKVTPTSLPSRSLSPSFTFSAAFLVLQKDTVTRGRGGKAAKVTKNPPMGQFFI